jgi:hypothetical protein
MNYFKELDSINVNDFTEQKNGLTYLSWAYAWRELKKMFQKSFYTIYENEKGWNYHTDGRTAWVKTGVTVVLNSVDETKIEHIEYLPIMDYKNRSIALDKVTSFEVNKTIQRSLTKAVARHGLGIYVYAGEDLPSESDGKSEPAKAKGGAISIVSDNDFQEEVDELQKPISSAQAKTITEFAQLAGVPIEDVLKHYELEKVEDMTLAIYGSALNKLKATRDKK